MIKDLYLQLFFLFIAHQWLLFLLLAELVLKIPNNILLERYSSVFLLSLFIFLYSHCYFHLFIFHISSRAASMSESYKPFAPAAAAV